MESYIIRFKALGTGFAVRELQRLMLWGGNPIPERPFAVRLITIVVVLWFAYPHLQRPLAVLQDQFFIFKMRVEEVEASLTRGHLASDYQCEKADTRRWDYVCTYARGDPRMKRMKIGVKVGHRFIIKISNPHELEAQYISP